MVDCNLPKVEVVGSSPIIRSILLKEKAMKVLVLEDSNQRMMEFRQRFLERGWIPTFTNTAKDAIENLQTKDFDIIFLDHDLGDEVYVDTSSKNTGSEVARWLNRNPKSCIVVIHSLNAPAALYMKGLIKGSYHIPYVWKEEIFQVSVKA